MKARNGDIVEETTKEINRLMNLSLTVSLHLLSSNYVFHRMREKMKVRNND